VDDGWLTGSRTGLDQLQHLWAQTADAPFAIKNLEDSTARLAQVTLGSSLLGFGFQSFKLKQQGRPLTFLLEADIAQRIFQMNSVRLRQNRRIPRRIPR